MKGRFSFMTAVLAATLAFSSAACAQAGQQQSSSKASAPAPKRDLSGVWKYQGSIGADPVTPDENMPPMTPWAKMRFDAEKPGYGTRGAPGGNDPVLQCDPIGFPRILFMPTPFEFVQAPGKVLQFWEREHQWRPIWTDGRSLPKDADPAWYGHAIGRWEGDDTLVVESTSFRDTTWLGPTGYPHSEDMYITERYHRVDHDTIVYDITISDPKAYTKPILAAQKIMKLRPNAEIEESVCVWSEENAFAKRIREPAASKPAK